MDAGRLDQRFRFEKRVDADDGHGNTVSVEWLPQFTAWTHRRFISGGEAVIAARLASRQPAVLTIRTSADARQVNASWRAVDDRSGVEYAIRENPRHPMRDGREDRGFLEMMVETGVAA